MHQKAIKLNPNTPWMQQNYKKTIKIDYFFKNLPRIILDSWKSKTFVNFYVQLALMDFRSQFLTSHAIFNCRAYAKRVD
jgi:hypothetical protein